MKREHLKTLLKGWKEDNWKNSFVLLTNADKFLSSSITWEEDLKDPEDYMVEISFQENKEILVWFCPFEEYFGGSCNGDWGDTIKEVDIDEFISEIIESADIFVVRFPSP